MSTSLDTRLVRTASKILDWLSRRNVDVLRVSLGLIFFGFGLLKFFPGASPAEALVARTVDALTFGLVDGRNAVLMTAGLECFIGLTLITGRLLRSGLLVLAVSLGGIMAPLVLFFNDLFPGGTPTLEGQYVLKDIVLAAAGLVIAASAFGSQYDRQPSRSELTTAA